MTPEPTQRHAKFEVSKSVASGRYFWLLKAANGEVVCNSEAYTTEADAWRAVRRLPAIAFDAAWSHQGE
jgi:uncharacterized protein YegP (UPF0339 family)